MAKKKTEDEKAAEAFDEQQAVYEEDDLPLEDEGDIVGEVRMNRRPLITPRAIDELSPKVRMVNKSTGEEVYATQDDFDQQYKDEGFAIAHDA